MLLYTESLQLFTRFIQFCHSLPFLRRLLLFQKKHDMLGDTGPAPAAPFSNYLEAKTYYDGTTDRPKASEAGDEGAAALRPGQPPRDDLPVPGPGAGAEPGGQLHGSYESGPAGHLHLHPHRPDEHGPGLRLRDVLHGHPSTASACATACIWNSPPFSTGSPLWARSSC